jgi:hypothetical protein
VSVLEIDRFQNYSKPTRPAALFSKNKPFCYRKTACFCSEEGVVISFERGAIKKSQSFRLAISSNAAL